MRIAMIGTGYVGLVSGTCFADFGHHVICVDKDQAKIDALLEGKMPIWEPGLDGLVAANVARGRLKFTTDLATAIAEAEAVFIAVGTPSRRGDGHADLSFVFAAVEELAKALDHAVVVVTKSTVPVGTGDKIAALLAEHGAPEGCSVASNPEFLREGAAIADFKHPNRILVGAEDERGREVLAEIYRPLFLNKAPLLFTGRRTAELTKYAANAFLAMKISFINEMADLCEAVGADVQDLARGIGLDNRIGPKFLHPGPGYGGSCFPKDTLALLRAAEEAGVEQRIIATVVSVNDARKAAMVDRVEKALGGLEGKRVGILGLTFKPNTDDMRDAPSVPLIKGLVDRGAEVVAFDPVGHEQARPLLPEIDFAAAPEDVADGADAVVVVTEWDEFRGISLKELAKRMRGNVLLDLRNIYGQQDSERAGLRHFGIGRGRRS
jgi:UDPglucose 6-dehydrogenase